VTEAGHGSAGVLDDPARLRALDPAGALGQASGLGRQLRRGYRTALESTGLPSGDGVRAVVVCGMGGSGVAGDVLRGLYADRVPIPIVVNKAYALPEFAGPHTLVTALSFSGNTEETLSAYGEAIARGCRVVAVSAGGQLAERAGADGVTHVPLPTDVPMPRMAVGDLSASLIGALEAMGLVPAAHEEVEEAASLVDDLAGRLGPDRPLDDNVSKELAAWIGERTPVVWGSEGLAEAPAGRFRTQVNENAKAPAFCHILPEVCHNELCGWGQHGDVTRQVLTLVELRHGFETPDVGRRFSLMDDQMLEVVADICTVEAEGDGPLAQLFDLVLFGDVTSLHLAADAGVDPGPIPALEAMKAGLQAASG
jgi:glucose/mannose-6-phosphate isomerase